MTKNPAYSTTAVPVSKSQEAIRKMLFEHDAQAISFHEEAGLIGLRFSMKVSDGVRVVRTRWVVPPPPERKRKRHTRFTRGKITSTKGDWERADQQVRMTYRALYYWLKSQFDAMDHDFRTFDQVFLNDLEYTFPDGNTATIEELLDRRGDLLLKSGGENEVVTAIEEA